MFDISLAWMCKRSHVGVSVCTYMQTLTPMANYIHTRRYKHTFTTKHTYTKAPCAYTHTHIYAYKHSRTHTTKTTCTRVPHTNTQKNKPTNNRSIQKILTYSCSPDTVVLIMLIGVGLDFGFLLE